MDMGEMLKYRGPDDLKSYSDEHISFIFRRLAILDVENGAQPIWNDDQTVFIAVNGEIYNHLELKKKYFNETCFTTNSDAEVVLHLYLKFGVDLFSKLNGMFAVAIWDTRKNELVLGRDRLGIKPLYFSQTKNGLLFGSELKTILAHPDSPREINWDDLRTSGVQDKSKISSYVEGIEHFPAGCFAKFKVSNLDELTPKNYWKLEDYLNTEKQVSIGEAIKNYTKLLEESLSMRLMSDVPVGLFLSGGIDSSILASLASRNNSQIHCFTVIESTTCASGDADNAKRLCETLGLSFHPIVFNLKKMLSTFKLEKLEKMVFMMESPRFDLEWYYKSELHKAAKALVPEMKVIILGQGADEFAGGYSKYLGTKFNSWREYLNLGVSTSNQESNRQEKKTPQRFSKIVQPLLSENKKLSGYKEKMLRFSYQLQHFNLWHEDRTSSFYGVESRVPFLDHRIVELLAALPTDTHEELFWNKSIVRQCAQKIRLNYPEDHPKVPFFVTGDNNNIANFAIGACKNIFENFIKKYKNTNSAKSINWEDMDLLFNESQKKNMKSGSKAWELLELMSIVIFQEICLTPLDYMKKVDHSLENHYPELDINNWDNLQGILGDNSLIEIGSVNKLSIINIPEDCEILNPLTELEGKTELGLFHNNTQLSRIEIPDSHIWIVMLLDEMGRHTTSPKDLAFWSEKAKIGILELLPIIQNLISGGFLTIISQNRYHAYDQGFPEPKRDI